MKYGISVMTTTWTGTGVDLVFGSSTIGPA